MANNFRRVWNNIPKTNKEYSKTIDENLNLSEVRSEVQSLNTFSYSPNLSVNFNTVGPKVSFTKSNYGSERDVLIPGELALTRGNNGGLYNPFFQTGYSNGGPTNTLWNSKYTDGTTYGWNNLENFATNRNYDSWSNAVNGIAAYTSLLEDFIVIHTETGRAWLIKFTSWTAGGNGGGFSYDRYELNVSTTFTRNDGAGVLSEARDIIIPGKLEIARLNNQYGIFNYPFEIDIIRESGYNEDYAMIFTEWNSEYTDSTNFGFDDLSNVRTRKYDAFVYALDGAVGNNILDTQLVMHNLLDDTYHKFTFTHWTQGGGQNGGGFEYTRTLIPQNSVITYPDNTIAKTASSGGSPDAENNFIIADTTSYTVAVGPGGSHMIPDFSGMLIVNDHWDGGVELWIAGGGDTIPVAATNTGGGPAGSTLQISGGGYEWTNVSNMDGPFTFTVIKTRNTA